MKALNSYRKQIFNVACKGFFGITCDNKSKVSGFCSSCYHKQNYLKDINVFLSQVFEIENMNMASTNILNFSRKPCKKCCVQKCTVSFPFCYACLSSEYGLVIRQSLIPGAGLGLFATKCFSKGESLQLTLSGTYLNSEEYTILCSQLDPESIQRQGYVLQTHIKDLYIEASKETGGPLRYLNQAPSHHFKNCKWKVINQDVTVETIGVVQAGCEFFLDYCQGQSRVPKFAIPSRFTLESLEQMEDISKHYIKTIQDEGKKKRRK